MPLKVYSLNSYNNNHSVCFTVSLRDSAPYPQTYSVYLSIQTLMPKMDLALRTGCLVAKQQVGDQ